jgi:hypothetical protein
VRMRARQTPRARARARGPRHGPLTRMSSSVRCSVAAALVMISSSGTAFLVGPSESSGRPSRAVLARGRAV